MPIYAYRCTSCGHAQDVLQKISDAVLTVCPSCGAAAFAKQVTAAGFQLKGSGWYVTDFRGGGSGGAAKPEGEGTQADAKTAEAGSKPADGGDKSATGGSPAPAAEKQAAPAAEKKAAAPPKAPAGPPSPQGSSGS